MGVWIVVFIVLFVIIRNKMVFVIVGFVIGKNLFLIGDYMVFCDRERYYIGIIDFKME